MTFSDTDIERAARALEPTDGEETRKAVARLIDLMAFKQIASAREFSRSHGDPEDYLDSIYLPAVTRAYAKADAILTLLSALPPRRPSEGEIAREITEPLARRAVSATQAAQQYAPGSPDHARCAGKAQAYAHAAELVVAALASRGVADGEEDRGA